VLERSVFDHLPGVGRWATVLLLDGNVGIGGDPPALLRRVACLLRVGGEAVVEVEPPGVSTETLMVRLQHPGHAPSAPFAWARVGADDVTELMAAAGMSVGRLEAHGHRWFARAVKQ
jgi:hypothetical protein